MININHYRTFGIFWRDRLIEDDHPARAVWELIGGFDLTRFLSPIGSINGQAGRPAFDPQLLISVWLYAYSRGISSAREIGRRCEYEPGRKLDLALVDIYLPRLNGIELLNRLRTRTAIAATSSAIPPMVNPG